MPEDDIYKEHRCAIPFISNDSESQPLYHSDLKENHEGLVLKSPRNKNGGLIDKLFSNKTKTLKSSVKALRDEIKIRQNLNIHLIDKIDEQIFTENQKIKHLDDLNINYLFESFIQLTKIKNKSENNVLDLSKEKRKEQLECWRDLMFLKKYLLISLKEYWDLVKRRELLEGDSG
jgi:hypothetical protein